MFLQYSLRLKNPYKANQSCLSVIFNHRDWVPLIIKSKHIIKNLPLGNFGHKIWHLILENISNLAIFFFNKNVAIVIELLMPKWDRFMDEMISNL